MENLYFAVIPSQAGIQWLQVLRDPRLRGDDGKLVFFDSLGGGNPLVSGKAKGKRVQAKGQTDRREI